MINDETIAHFANLRYLKINKVNNAIFESLKKLSHLKEIEIVGRRHTRSSFNLPDYLKELEIMTLRQSSANGVNIHELQQRYQHVRFRWFDENGVYYEGTFSKDCNVPDGRGKFKTLCGRYCDSIVYDGELKNGIHEGKGNFYCWGENYEGEWKNNLYHGKGAIIWPDGSHYKGEWKNGIYYGKGILHSVEGDRYDGEWKDGKKEGKGTYLWDDGSRYEGEYSNDLREGKGIFYSLNDEISEGEWKKDQLL